MHIKQSTNTDFRGKLDDRVRADQSQIPYSASYHNANSLTNTTTSSWAFKLVSVFKISMGSHLSDYQVSSSALARNHLLKKNADL